jgi:aminopeptidase
MNEIEFMDWLSREDILNIAKKHKNSFINVLKQCLDVKKEKLLLLGDHGYPTRRISPLLTACYLLAAKELDLNYEFVLQEPKRGLDRADSILIDRLFHLPDKSALVINMSGKIGQMDHVGKSFRKYCKIHNHKFASTTSLSSIDTFMIKSVISAISIDYKKMQKDDKLIKLQISSGKIMKVTTRAGTNLTIDLKEVLVKSADGNYKEFGKGGNVPAGEVYFAPYNCNGIVIIDGSSRNIEDAVLIQKPITLIVKDNKVIEIKGQEEAKLLEDSLKQAEARAKYPERIRYLAEFGIGTNTKAKLIGTTIIDEKALGTAHIAIGSNYWFGGTNRTIIHYDQVFKSPKIRIDGKPLKM